MRPRVGTGETVSHMGTLGLTGLVSVRRRPYCSNYSKSKGVGGKFHYESNYERRYKSGGTGVCAQPKHLAEIRTSLRIRTRAYRGAIRNDLEGTARRAG